MTKAQPTHTGMHPFLKYPGGKTGEIPLVLSHLPAEMERYVEPFVGGGSIYFAVNAPKAYINDKSADLYLLYVMVREQNPELKKHLALFDTCWKALSEQEIGEWKLPSPCLSEADLEKFYLAAKKKKEQTVSGFQKKGIALSEDNYRKVEVTARKTAFYMLIRKLYNTTIADKPLRVACYYFLREYCYSSMFRYSAKGDFNVPYGGMSYNEKYMRSKIDYMYSAEMEAYLRDTVIGNEDFEVFLDGIGLTERDFLFLDPPYDTVFSTYDQNPFDKAEQLRLRDYLAATAAKWMLIIKKTDFTAELYQGFHLYEYDKNYTVSFKNRNDRDVKHLLITNYDI